MLLSRVELHDAVVSNPPETTFEKTSVQVDTYARFRTAPLWSGKVKQSNNRAYRVVDSQHTFGRNTFPSPCKTNNLS